MVSLKKKKKRKYDIIKKMASYLQWGADAHVDKKRSNFPAAICRRLTLKNNNKTKREEAENEAGVGSVIPSASKHRLAGMRGRKRSFRGCPFAEGSGVSEKCSPVAARRVRRCYVVAAAASHPLSSRRRVLAAAAAAAEPEGLSHCATGTRPRDE